MAMWHGACLAFLWAAGLTTAAVLNNRLNSEADVPESCETPDLNARSSSLLQTTRSVGIQMHQKPPVRLAKKSTGKSSKAHKKTAPKSKKLSIKTVDLSKSFTPSHQLTDAKIDFVYCWAGSKAQINDTKRDNVEYGYHVEGYGYNEMQMSIQSLQRYAPWFNKAYVLVNGIEKPILTTTGYNDPRIVMTDRCTLFPNKSDCPTKNTAACQAVAHLIPGLQEQFVYMEDDNIFLAKLTPSDFFSKEGLPRFNFNPEGLSLTDMYGPPPLPKGPDMPPEHVPERLYYILPHGPMPMLKNFSSFLETEYKDWFAFVRSHKTRFKCCDASVATNGLAELFHTMYPAMLHKYGVGQTDYFHCMTCGCGSSSCITKAMKDYKCMVLQNCYDAKLFNASHDLLRNRTG